MTNMGTAPGRPAGRKRTVNGKYVIERRLGSGGMAEVFLARTVGAEGFSRQVAIKRVLSGFSDNPQFAKFFVSEAQLTSRLQHPNIVSVLDFDRDQEGRLFLVMELVDGTDLDGLLATGPLPPPVVIYLAAEILRGLDYAHDLPLDGDKVRGIVHRDISPHNILLSWNGAVKVSDFGIAKARAASNASASVTVKGKPAYMSPEQAEGQPLDGRSDLFSIGVMLWEMLCMRHLFAAETTAATIARVLNAPIPAPREERPEIPEDLSRAVSWLLARDRQKRPPNAEAAIAALVACVDYPRDGREALMATLAQRFVGRAPIRGRGSVPTPGRWVESPRPVVALPPGARTLTPQSGFRFTTRRRRWPWALLAMFVAATTTAGTVLATRHTSASAPPLSPHIEVTGSPVAPPTIPPAAPMGQLSADSASASPSASLTAVRTPGSGAATSADDATASRAIVPPATAMTTHGAAAAPPGAPPKRLPAPPKRHPEPTTDGIREIQLGSP